jgi:hypothetical protein
VSEMVERAARAIAKQHGTDPDMEGPGRRHAVPMEDGTTAILTDHFGPLWKMWSDDARAALSAALDPEDEALCALVQDAWNAAKWTGANAGKCVIATIKAAAQGERDA